MAMKDLLLIKKIKPLGDSDKVFPYTFVLDKNFSKQKAMDIFSSLKAKGIIDNDEFMIKDGAFTVNIISKYTTKVIKEILDKNLDIYGIYIPYEEYLEKGEINE